LAEFSPSQLHSRSGSETLSSFSCRLNRKQALPSSERVILYFADIIINSAYMHGWLIDSEFVPHARATPPATEFCASTPLMAAPLHFPLDLWCYENSAQLSFHFAWGYEADF
jgi:hypothetical protein